MNVKSQKGFTGIDITIAIIVITLFVSIISVVFYNITISSKKVERKTEATYIAQDVIEKIKALDYDEAIETQGEDAVDIGSYKNNNKYFSITKSNIVNNVQIDTEDANTKYIYINNNKAFVSVKNDKIIILWSSSGFLYTIDGNTDYNTLINIAKNIE